MGNSSMKTVPEYEDFRILAGEYEKLRAAGLNMEEIYSLLATRLQKSLVKGSNQTGDLIGTPKIIGPGSREDIMISPEHYGMQQHAYSDDHVESKTTDYQPLPVVQGAASFSNGVVLLIDDSPVAARVASKVLATLHFEVIVANSAQTGFDLLMGRKEDINLVFLDVVMPNVDGVECLGWIKECPDVAHIPVYMLSGLEDNMLSEVCLERGAEGMLLKPLKPDLVIDIMKSQNIGHLDEQDMVV
ncbi:response regulator, partial [archaeon]